MRLKGKIFILSVFLIFLSLLCVCASDNSQNVYDINYILENTNASDMTGCCSVVLQMDGNDTIMSFRRDANLTADISVEYIDWHGTPAMKQYKTEGGYFCQVIITEDGWVIGYGGKDDGDDNKKIEEITSEMISDDNSISEDGLIKIQEIKKRYKIGHVVIKAPNGNYGIATATTHLTGKLNPGEYVSVPNNYNYFRSGNISLSSQNKIGTMTELAASDMFGLARRDITTFYYHHVDNDTYKGYIIDAFVSNDDGSMYAMNCRDKVDNVYFNNEMFPAENIPIAPNYKSLGTIVFPDNGFRAPKILILTTLVLFAILVGLLYVLVSKVVRNMRYHNNRRR